MATLTKCDDLNKSIAYHITGYFKVFDTERGDYMSTPDTQHTDLDAQTVSSIANLARLSLNDTQSKAYAQSLNKILDMMHTLKNINTEGVEPLKSPFDNPQPLRDDYVSQSNHRNEYQAVAPSVEQGLYLVPRVIE